MSRIDNLFKQVTNDAARAVQRQRLEQIELEASLEGEKNLALYQTRDAVIESKKTLSRQVEALEKIAKAAENQADIAVEKPSCYECNFETKQEPKASEPEKIAIKVEVDGLDEIISKTDSLKPMLVEAKTLLSELSSAVDALEFEIFDKEPTRKDKYIRGL